MGQLLYSTPVQVASRPPIQIESGDPEMGAPTITTYTKARARLASLCDQVASSREPVYIRRRGSEDVALVSADELASLLETAHLFRSPANARRLLAALQRSEEEELAPTSIEELRDEMGLGTETDLGEE